MSVGDRTISSVDVLARTVNYTKTNTRSRLLKKIVEEK